MAGIGGMIVPVAIFLAIAGSSAPTGAWGTAMSTDTAFALGMLALVGRRFPNSLRAFMLTVSVVDDLVALLVIAIAFTTSLNMVALAAGLGAFALVLVARSRGVHSGAVYLPLGLIAWVAVLKSGIDPVVVGLAMGLLTIAFPAARGDLEQATDLFRLFREQPTSELQQSATAGLRSTISPNERWTQMFHPFTSYVIVPLFALANAGFAINGSFLVHAYGSAITLGILIAYLVGKPIGIFGGANLVTRLSRGRLRLPVGWASVLGGGSIAGIGFTVSLLIASLAFHGAGVVGGQARRADDADRGAADHPRGSAVGAAIAEGDAPQRADRYRRHDRRPGGPGRSRTRPHPRPDGGGRDVGGVRGSGVSLLRSGRAGDPRAALRSGQPPLCLAPPAAQRRPPGGADGGRGDRRRRRSRVGSGTCTTS